MKRTGKKRNGKTGRTGKGKVLKAVDGFRLEQPIQTALYAKLWRLGYDA